MKRLSLASAVLCTALATTGCASSSSSSSSGEDNSAKNASESNTPRVGPKGSVEVDDLRWHLESATTTATIGQTEFGGATANGIYVVVALDVTNNKSESVTLTDDTVSLTAGKVVYKPDSTGTINLPGKSLTIADLGPSVTLSGELAFDVAPAILAEHPALRFNELGFGSTHGYIRLPRLHS